MSYVPLISSGVAGPLGALHLPRLWLKVSLEAAGKLASGYPGIGAGYDMMTCNALGLDPEAEGPQRASIEVASHPGPDGSLHRVREADLPAV